MDSVKQFLNKHFYLLISLLTVGVSCCLLLYRVGTMPAGLLASEIKYGEAASKLWQTHQIETSVNLPWLMLEAGSIGVLGASPFSMRLPAAICAIVASGLIIYLSGKLTKCKAGAVLGALLTVTSMGVLNLGRHAEPWAMTLLLIMLVLWAGHRVLNHEKGLLLGFIAAMLLMTMTGGIVLCLCLLLIIILHPCLRLCMAKHRGLSMAGAAVGTLLLAAFAVLTLRTNTSIGELVGSFSVKNLLDLGQDLAGASSRAGSSLVTPLGTIVGLTLAVLGTITLCIRSSFSIRSYLTVGFTASSIILGAFEPSFVWLMIIPLWLAQTVALDEIIDRWYSLFPFNPYPRVLALVPIVILASSLALGDVTRYIGAVNYDRNIAYRYNYDLAALINATDGDDQYDVLAPSNMSALLGATGRNNLRIISSIDDTDDGDKLVLFGGQKAPSNYRLERVEANWLSHNAVIARVYAK